MQIRTDIVVKLLQLPRVGKKTVFKILDGLDFPIASDMDLFDVLEEKGSLLKLPTFSQSEFQKAMGEADEILEKSERENIAVISWYHKDYPEALKRMGQEKAPLVLNIKGDLQVLHEKKGVAVIGTREPTEYGQRVGERLGELFGGAGLNVVSGLALGCDTAGHRGCLKANGTTTAVMGEGLQKIYPKENKALASEILEKGGVLVSEYFIGATARPSNFVDRDRIQAGLSECVTVVETDIKGGTMHTVNFAMDFKRLLAAFNHTPEKQSDKSRGNQQIIREGKATGLANEADIRLLIERIKLNGNPHIIHQPQIILPQPITKQPTLFDI